LLTEAKRPPLRSTRPIYEDENSAAFKFDNMIVNLLASENA
jgi:hypothetical protein